MRGRKKIGGERYSERDEEIDREERASEGEKQTDRQTRE